MLVTGAAGARAESPAPEQAHAAERPEETSIHFDQKARAGKKDLISTLHADGHFETLLKALDTSGLAQYVKTKAPLTMLVPNDDAFAKLPAGTLERWQKDPQQLKQILRYHIIKAYVPSKQLLRLRNALTLSGAVTRFDATTGSDGSPTLVINWDVAKIIKWDIMAKNGVAHVIDNVLRLPAHQIPKAGAKKDAKHDGEKEEEG